MNHLLSIAKKYRFFIIIYLALGLSQTFLQSFGAKYLQTVIDNFAARTLTPVNIAVYGAAMISLYLICYLDEYPGRKLENGFVLGLKTAALKKISVIDYLSCVKIGTGTLIQRIENGARAGGNILFEFYLKLACELLPAMIFSIAFIATISVPVTAAILAGYAAVFLVTRILLSALYKVKESILVNEEKYNNLLVRGFTEMVVFRVNRRFAREIKKAEAAADEIISSKIKIAMTHEAFFAIFAVLIGFVKIGIIIYGWRAGALTIGRVVALIALVDNAYTPIAIFNVNYVQFKLDKIAFNRYAEFLDQKDDARLIGGFSVKGADSVGSDEFSSKGGVSFKNVDFCYEGREIFGKFNLEIKKGKFTALVGESGSGKSTAVKLAAGLLRPDAGEVFSGGCDLNKINLNDYYGRIAYIPQEASVFDGSLRENLVFDEEVDEKSLIEAIEKTGLAELFSKLEEGLDTRLGERGIGLSGGERQLLALARLWFSDAEIIFFDEATSATDNLTEEAAMKNVAELLKGRTVVSVAHRLDSIKNFDEIFVFKNGEIVESGDFDGLMRAEGYFYELYKRKGKA